jgi:hypothetical protein
LMLKKGCLNVCLLWVCFTLVSSILSITFPYPFTSHSPFFKSFQCTFLYPLPSHPMQYSWCSIILFSFPAFPKFCRVAPLL